jgi:alpha-L-fucosidase
LEILETVGKWLDTNGKTIYDGERMKAQSTSNLNFTRRGNTLYVHVTFWPGHTPAAEWLDFYKPEVVVALAGLKAKALSARFVKNGQKVELTQDEFTLRLTGLPLVAPDQPATVIEVECDGEPVIDHSALRPLWPRHKVGISV